MKGISSYYEMTDNTEFPYVKDGIGFVCPQKEKVMDFFNKNSTSDAILTCSASDYITGERFKDSIKRYSDGNYYWTNEEVYHFKKYDLKLNDDFISYVLNQTSQKESA